MVFIRDFMTFDGKFALKGFGVWEHSCNLLGRRDVPKQPMLARKSAVKTVAVPWEAFLDSTRDKQQ